MPAAVDHVDGLLPDDLAVFVDVLSRHGRSDTLRSDIEELVDARFTAELLADYDAAWGGSADFVPRSLIRLTQDGVTPDLARQALERGNLTVNDAIRDVESTVAGFAALGVDRGPALRAYRFGATVPDATAGLTFSSGFAVALQICELCGCDFDAANEIYSHLQHLKDEVVFDVASALAHYPTPLSSRELVDAVAATAVRGKFSSITVSNLAVHYRMSPEIMQAGAAAGLPLSRVLDIVMSSAWWDGDRRATVNPTPVTMYLAALLPEDQPVDMLVDLTRTVHTADATGLNGASPEQIAQDLYATYMALPSLSHAARVDALTAMRSPSAAAVLEQFSAQLGFPAEYSYLTLMDLAKASAALQDVPAQEIAEYVDVVLQLAGVGSNIDQVRGPALRSLDLAIPDVAAYVADQGLDAARASATASGVSGPARIRAHARGVPIENLARFTELCPQVNDRVAIEFTARGYDPQLCRDVHYALPFATANELAEVLASIHQSDVPPDVAAERVRTATLGNPTADPTGIVFAALGDSRMLSGDWDCTDTATALFDREHPELGQVDPAWADRASPLRHAESFTIPSPILPVTAESLTRPWDHPTRAQMWPEATAAAAVLRSHFFRPPGSPAPTRAEGKEVDLALDALKAALGKNSHARRADRDPAWNAVAVTYVERALAAEQPDVTTLRRLVASQSSIVLTSDVHTVDNVKLLAAMMDCFPEASSALHQLVHIATRAFSPEAIGEDRRLHFDLMNGHQRPATEKALMEIRECISVLPAGSTLTPQYVYEFARAYPKSGAAVMLVNFVTGHPPNDMPRAIRKAAAEPAVARYALSYSLLKGSRANHALQDRDTYNAPFSNAVTERNPAKDVSTSRSSNVVLAAFNPDESRSATVHRSESRTKEAASVSAPVAPAMSLAAHGERISKVVDWYAALLVDPLWTETHAPAILDRRSLVFSRIEQILVQLQDHPLMRGSVDASVLEHVHDQAAPSDLAGLTAQLEMAMNAAWTEAVQTGTTYPTREVPVDPHARMEELTSRQQATRLQAQAADLLVTAQGLRLDNPDSTEGAAKHAKATELEEQARAASQAAEGHTRHADALARDVEGIKRLVQSVGTAPILAATSLDALANTRALAARETPALPGAPGPQDDHEVKPRVKVSVTPSRTSRDAAPSLDR